MRNKHQENDMGLFDRFKKKDNAAAETAATPKTASNTTPNTTPAAKPEPAPAQPLPKEVINYELDTPRTRELYQQIADKLTDMIPDQWSDLYLYGEVLDDSTTAYFYYRQAQNGAMLYCHYIPDVYKVSKAVYNKMLLELHDLLRGLRDEYKNSGKNVWTNFTLKLDSEGGFSINYKYDDVLSSKFNMSQRHEFWRYEVLGRIPVEEKMRDALKKYLGPNAKLPKKNKYVGQIFDGSKCPMCGSAEMKIYPDSRRFCLKCQNVFFVDSHSVIMYIYDAKLIEAVVKSQKFTAAKDYSNALKELTPYENDAWDNLGLIMALGDAYNLMGYWDLAKNWYYQATCIKPDYARAYNENGFIEFKLKKYSSAVSKCGLAVKYIDEDPDTYEPGERARMYAIYGGALLGAGKKEEGEAYLQKAEAAGYTNTKNIRNYVGL